MFIHVCYMYNVVRSQQTPIELKPRVMKLHKKQIPSLCVFQCFPDKNEFFPDNLQSWVLQSNNLVATDSVRLGVSAKILLSFITDHTV